MPATSAGECPGITSGESCSLAISRGNYKAVCPASVLPPQSSSGTQGALHLHHTHLHKQHKHYSTAPSSLQHCRLNKHKPVLNPNWDGYAWGSQAIQYWYGWSLLLGLRAQSSWSCFIYWQSHNCSMSFQMRYDQEAMSIINIHCWDHWARVATPWPFWKMFCITGLHHWPYFAQAAVENTNSV